VNKTYTLQFFSSPTGNTNSYGEGRVFLGQTNLTLGASCSSNFTAVLPVSVPSGWIVTATATDPANNTSEFSAWTNAVTTIVPPMRSSVVNPASQQFSLSWTNNGGTFVLERAFSLNTPLPWTPIITNNANGFFVLTLPATNGTAFYILQAQ
jgi:hypothetical protein